MEQASIKHQKLQCHVYYLICEQTITLRIQSSSCINDSAICKEMILALSYYAMYYIVKSIISKHPTLTLNHSNEKLHCTLYYIMHIIEVHSVVMKRMIFECI